MKAPLGEPRGPDLKFQWHTGTSQVVQWLGLCASTAGGMGSISGLGSKILHASQFSSVQFSHSVVSDFLQPHGLQHARPPCPSPTSGAYPNSCPLNRWCHLTISSSVVPISSRLQSFPCLTVQPKKKKKEKKVPVTIEKVFGLLLD